MRHASQIKRDLAILGAETEVGFRADSSAAERIRALAAELEAINPTPEPASAAALLRGRWRLLYSNIDLLRKTTLGQLSFNILPDTGVRVAELFNEVDPASGLWDNVITFDALDSGEPGTAVIMGSYAAVDDAEIDIRFTGSLVVTATAPVRLPINREQLPDMRISITYLDESFRMIRGNHGILYIFERLDAAPLRWSRDI